jgi:Domain of unknown function (DUF4864)
MHSVVTCVASAVLAGVLLAQTAAPPEMTRAAGDTVMRQLEAFRSGDYGLAYTFASSAIRQQFDLASFERMVMGGYPEIARSASAVVTDSQLDDDGSLLLHLTIRGLDGNAVDAVYRMVLEGSSWRISGVVTRPPSGERASHDSPASSRYVDATGAGLRRAASASAPIGSAVIAIPRGRTASATALARAAGAPMVPPSPIPL